ncbi:hypothetical protein CSB20_12360 [bacterium DOLZORAL124_64_63]|nr:MAG: hypothetical protein CSB20_12360 [bacterium DOLZORAL124_64_63]
MSTRIRLARCKNGTLDYDLESRKIYFRIAGVTIRLCSCCFDQMAAFFTEANQQLESIRNDGDGPEENGALLELMRAPEKP